MGLFFDYENVKVGECIICGKDITVDQEVKQKVTVNGSLTGKQLADDCYICDRCAQKYSLEKKELKTMTKEKVFSSSTERGAVSPDDFRATKALAWGAGGYPSFEVDESRNLMRFTYMDIGIFSKNKFQEKLRRMDDLVDFQLFDSGSSVVEGNSLLGAAIGGATFGGAGAIVGSGATSKNVESVCDALSLRVVFDDLSEPDEYIYFIGDEKSAAYIQAKRSGDDFKDAMQSAQACISFLTVILKRNEERKNQANMRKVMEASQPKQVHASVSNPAPAAAKVAKGAAASHDEIIDAIKKLGALYKDGVLTEEEFTTKKSELLSRL